MNIIFEDGQDIKKEILDMMKRAASKALELEGLGGERGDRLEISVTFVSPEEIKKINKQFRQIDKVTDVLSFPQFDDIEQLENSLKLYGDCQLPYDADDELLHNSTTEVVEEISLGDVLICIERAKEQAEEFGHSLDREIVYLFVHSICHLLGYDHMQEDEKSVMRAREEEIMQFIELPRI